MLHWRLQAAWILGALALVGCAKKDAAPQEPAGKDAAAAVDRSDAARAALIDRLNTTYKDKGVARIEGEVLVVSSAQCRDESQAARVVSITKKAAARVGIDTVRCEAPAAPSKEELVAVFNERFSDIQAKARIDDDGRTLTLIAGPCAKEGEARRLLRDAAPLSRDAGFELVRCGAEGGTLFELAVDAVVPASP